MQGDGLAFSQGMWVPEAGLASLSYRHHHHRCQGERRFDGKNCRYLAEPGQNGDFITETSSRMTRRPSVRS